MKKTVGVIGAGQLGQMLGYAGLRMGLDFVFLDPADDPPAAVTGPVLRFPFDSEEGLAKLVAMTDIITYEFENVPVSAIERLDRDTTVYPPAVALASAQDRLVEKAMFQELDIPVPSFRSVESPDDLERAASEIGLPIVLKTRRFGYDGKGQFIVTRADEFSAACSDLGGSGLIAEQWVPFQSEISALGARSPGGEIVHYPLTENVHDHGILSLSRAPASAALFEETAQRYLASLLNHLDYVGVLALELFVTESGLKANEFAPRVHNSGHWTIEGSNTSQFENHLRAILGMPLGDTSLTGFAGMFNLIGKVPGKLTAPDDENWHIHDYGKRPRPGRKLGHVTIVADSIEKRERALSELAAKLADLEG